MLTHSSQQPVLVGVGVASQRQDDPRQALEPIQLMLAAIRSAAKDAGDSEMLRRIDVISVPRGMWSYSNPAGWLAQTLGAYPKTVLGEIGVLQQTLIGDACRRIAGGKAEIVVVVGGEAKYRQLRASILGVDVEDLMTEGEPDELLKPEAELWSPIEAAAGLGMPVGYYALMESALRAKLGESIEGNQNTLAQLYARFSAVAVRNEDAWDRQAYSAEDILSVEGSNRMLAFPYTKRHNSQWNVDQASALIFCSEALAHNLGLDQEKWVYPLASTESNHMVNTAQRADIAACPGARIAAEAALDHAGLSIDEMDFLELYSCFPAAVRSFAHELGVPLSTDLTVTGGMPFGGGPLNNFVLQATAKLAQCIRAKGSGRGLVSSVSGMNTKQGFGLWSAQPEAEFHYMDVSERVASESEERTLVEPRTGEALVLAITVLFDRGEPQRAVAIVEYGSDRSVVSSDQPAVMECVMSEECVGRRIMVNSSGQFTFSNAPD